MIGAFPIPDEPGDGACFLKSAGKERLDKLLVEKGTIPSREKARALIMEGKVLVRGQTVDKPGTRVEIDTEIQIRGEEQPM